MIVSYIFLQLIFYAYEVCNFGIVYLICYINWLFINQSNKFVTRLPFKKKLLLGWLPFAFINYFIRKKETEMESLKHIINFSSNIIWKKFNSSYELHSIFRCRYLKFLKGICFFVVFFLFIFKLLLNENFLRLTNMQILVSFYQLLLYDTRGTNSQYKLSDTNWCNTIIWLLPLFILINYINFMFSFNQYYYTTLV